MREQKGGAETRSIVTVPTLSRALGSILSTRCLALNMPAEHSREAETQTSQTTKSLRPGAHHTDDRLMIKTP